MCPYARFQSAMIDKDTLIVSYDSARGEPRGSRKRGVTSSTLGDCTDCQLCVQVCPTGIDIRNGLQYECIGCAHCVDACAQVMDKMGYAPGLIRYTTATALNGGKIRILRGKSIGYAAVCTLLVSAFVVALINRTPLEIDILRPRDALFQALADGAFRNDYQLVIANKTQHDACYQLQLIEPANLRLDAPQTIEVEAGQVENIPFSVAGKADAANTVVIIKACTADGLACNAEETRFLAPAGRPS